MRCSYFDCGVAVSKPPSASQDAENYISIRAALSVDAARRILTGIASCARAASGHVAAPPTSVMNSRLIIR